MNCWNHIKITHSLAFQYEVPIKNIHNLKLTTPLIYFIITTTVLEHDDGAFDWYKVEIPQNCTFITESHLQLPVACHPNVSCKGSVTETNETKVFYESVNGYNWEAQATDDSEPIQMVKIGAVAPTGGPYTCRHLKNQGRSTYECTEETNRAKLLEFYNIQSNVQCWFGTVTMHRETRNGLSSMRFEEHFTSDELEHLAASAGADLNKSENSHLFLVDVDEISNFMLQALIDELGFNPSTDVIERVGTRFDGGRKPIFTLHFFGNPTKDDDGDVKSIPFTIPQGDDVHSGACISSY